MSTIKFQTQDADLGTVHGTERTRGLDLAIDASLRALGAEDAPGVHRLIRDGILPSDALAFTAFGHTPPDALRAWMRDPLGFTEVTIGDTSSPVSHAVLNTAAVDGPDAVAFLARLHGSVEECIWVAAEDTGWLAALLAAGREDGTLRADAGWEAVIDQIAAASGPIVISSSQGREFPEQEYDEDTDEPLLSQDVAWRESLARLQGHGWWLQLSPANLRQPAYTPLATFHDLVAMPR